MDAFEGFVDVAEGFNLFNCRILNVGLVVPPKRLSIRLAAIHKVFATDAALSNRSPITKAVSPSGFSIRESFRRNRKTRFTTLHNIFDSGIYAVSMGACYTTCNLPIYTHGVLFYIVRIFWSFVFLHIRICIHLVHPG